MARTAGEVNVQRFGTGDLDSAIGVVASRVHHPLVANYEAAAWGGRLKLLAVNFRLKRNAFKELGRRHVPTIVPIQCKCGALVELREFEFDFAGSGIRVAVVLRTFGFDSGR